MHENISVALCTYNGSKYISEQLISILNQSMKPAEIVLCDDNSTDNTVQIASAVLKQYEVPFRIEKNTSNIGVVRNFEKAIKMCTGDIIFTSDQDDVWVETKIEDIYLAMMKNQDIQLAFSDAYLTDSKLVRKKERLWDIVCPQLYKQGDESIINCPIYYGNIVTGATMAFRRSLLIYALPFNEFWIHDYWLAINAILYGKIIAVNKQLIMYRQHDNNVLGARSISVFERVKIYLKDIDNIENIRVEYLSKYKKLAEHCMCTESVHAKSVNSQIENVVNFWQDLSRLNSTSFFQGVKVVVGKCLSGDYNNYYTGIKGALRDIMYLFRR